MEMILICLAYLSPMVHVCINSNGRMNQVMEDIVGKFDRAQCAVLSLALVFNVILIPGISHHLAVVLEEKETL